ncbi:hypothetical protein QWY79_12845 [Halomonas sabkhae]|uniref:hypothetical protein n=1 Tax=Halomonas sabkhae TaxID=626223 RepID=UPI0025B46E26|nr:hypothetical protein [Halomonas sabkhae]MDN3526153.1 hypothetical protein [Halomonas sabkhae]
MHLKNVGIVTYRSVIFNFIPADGLAGLPITGLLMGGWGGVRETGDFGLFEAGSTKILIANLQQDHPGSNFRMQLTCKDENGQASNTTVTGELVAGKRD